jgi:hypothetical protein
LVSLPFNKISNWKGEDKDSFMEVVQVASQKIISIIAINTGAYNICF